MVSEHAPWCSTASTRAEVAARETRVELAAVEVVGDARVAQVAVFGAVREVVDRDDVVDAGRVEAAQQVGADHAGSAGDHHFHCGASGANSSS